MSPPPLMSSNNTRFSSSRGHGRTGSKVEQFLRKEEAERQAVAARQRRQARLERKQRAKYSSSGSSRSSTSKKPPAASKKQSSSTSDLKITNGVKVDGNTFTVAGLRTQSQRNQGLTLGSVLSQQSRAAIKSVSNTRQSPPSKAPPRPRVAKGAFAALDTDSDSDDEEPQQAPPSKEIRFGDDSKTRDQQETSQAQWAGFLSGDYVAPAKPYQPEKKAAVIVMERPEQAHDDSDSDSEEDAFDTAYDTDGDYESDEEFGLEPDMPDFDDETDGAW